MKTPTWRLSTLPSRTHHCRWTPTDMVPLSGNAEGSKTITASGTPESSPTWRARVDSNGVRSQGTSPGDFCKPWRSRS